MARIIITDLDSSNAEGLINQLDNQDAQAVFGGYYQYQYGYNSPIFAMGLQFIEFMVIIAAIDAITYITTSFGNEDSYKPLDYSFIYRTSI
jgi:hypothetical protein